MSEKKGGGLKWLTAFLSLHLFASLVGCLKFERDSCSIDLLLLYGGFGVASPESTST